MHDSASTEAVTRDSVKEVGHVSDSASEWLLARVHSSQNLFASTTAAGAQMKMNTYIALYFSPKGHYMKKTNSQN